MTSGLPVSVVVADDHPMFLEGLVAALRSDSSIEVVGQALDGADAVRVAIRERPRVAILDLHMPNVNGIEATRALAESAPETRVLVLTMVESDESIFGALRAGASGYLLKGARRQEIVNAVHAVAEGTTVFSTSVAERVLRGRGGADAPSTSLTFSDVSGLTERELEVATLAAQGLTNGAIAERLHISQKTVRNYVSNVLLKLHADDRTQLATRLLERGDRPGAIE